ncbi:unnamed protein product [Heterobilharzia americana]|nr:unnamed protein product [Heterobilharzia americana]
MHQMKSKRWLLLTLRYIAPIYLFNQMFKKNTSMDTFISSVTKCISDACQNAVSIDFEKLIDEFETKSASLARPLFSSDNADFTTEKAHSYCINPDVIQSQSNTQDFSSAYPKVMKFIYPSEDEIKAEQLDVMHLLTYKSVNETRNVVSPDFDDSFTSLDLTQIMNTSEVNYRNLSSYIPNQTFPDSPEKLKVCNKTAVSSECRYFPNELQMPVCVISSKEKLIQAVTQDDLTNLQPILNDANNVPCLSDHAKNPVYEDISLKSGVIPNLLLKPSSEFETIEAPTSEAQTFVHHISLYKSCMPHESNTNPNFTGFKTGKGDSVMLTSASSKKFAQTLVDALDVVEESVVVESNSETRDYCSTGFKTGKGDSVMLTSASSKKFAQTLVDALDVVEESVVVESNSETRDYCSTGFKTGKGDSVMLTSASSKKFAQTLVDALDVVEESVVVESNSETRDYCSTGFKTGKGDSVMLTSASSKQFAQTLADSVSVHIDNIYLERNSQFLNVSEINDALDCNRKRVITVPCVSSESLSCEVDPLVGCCFDTQFDFSLEVSKETSQTVETDLELELEREKARINQQDLIANKKSLISSNQYAISDHTTTATTTSWKFQSCGLLWSIRRRCNGNDVLNASEKQSSVNWKVLLSNQKPLTTTLHLPKYIKFPEEISKWSLQTSDKLYWLWDMKCIMDADDKSFLPVYYNYRDFTVIPDKFGCVGKQEIVNAFLSCPQIHSNLVSFGWIDNHYSQIMWKIGTIALLYSDLSTTLLSDYCIPSHVLNELHYRYDREIEGCQRSALRKIVEQDDTAARRLILCVSYLEVSEKCVKACLTDGWYQISWNPDPMLITLIKAGKIRVGSKLVTAGAELITTDPLCTENRSKRNCSTSNTSRDEFRHLYGDDSTAIGVSLKLHGNSTRPASWHSRLGFSVKQPSSGSGLYPVPLCTISSDGGLCSSIRVVIQRRYSLQYMETLEVPEQNTDTSATLVRTNSGTDESFLKSRLNRRRIFRSERAEEAEVRLHETMKSRIIDSALDKLVFNDPNKRRIQPTPEQLNALGNDGEALLHMILNAPDSAEAESNLTSMQHDAIQLYKESVIRDAVTENVPPRQVTPLLRLRVSGIHPKDIAGNYGACITLWSPTDEMISILKEGEVVEFYRLQASVTRVNDPFASPPPLSGFVKPIGVNIPSGYVLSLSGGRTTRVFSLGHISKLGESIPIDKFACIYRPRVTLTVTDVYRIANEQEVSVMNSNNKGNIEVDMRCLIIAVYLTSTNLTKSWKDQSINKSIDNSRLFDTPFKYPSSDVDCVYVTDVDCKSETCLLCVIKFWDGLQVSFDIISLY